MPDGTVLFFDLLAIAIVVWVFQLVRRDRLYVGFGVIFVIVIIAGALMLTIPALLRPFQVFAGLPTRSPALVGLALVFVLVMLIYTLTQTTLLSNRVAKLTQELAIRSAESGADAAHLGITASQDTPKSRTDRA